MHTCAATCCADQIASIDQVQRCVENCSRDMTQAQNLVQNELGQFQERLQRGVLLCQDRIKEKVGPNPTEAEFRRYKGEFENCAVESVNYHLGQLPSLMEKLKKALN
jgi:hypothetical protein